MRFSPFHFLLSLSFLNCLLVLLFTDSQIPWQDGTSGYFEYLRIFELLTFGTKSRSCGQKNFNERFRKLVKLQLMSRLVDCILFMEGSTAGISGHSSVYQPDAVLLELPPEHFLLLFTVMITDFMTKTFNILIMP